MSIIIENLSHFYNSGASTMLQALDGVSITIERGDWVSIVGHTGSGKSTLAQHMNALLTPQSGRVEIDGVEVGPKTKKLRELRRKVGLVFQYPEQQFFAETVSEEISFAPSNWGVNGDALELRVREAALSVGLDPDLLHSNPFSLSGGQRRRVALASVMSMKPDYLVLDEPTAGLDAAGIRELIGLLAKVKAGGIAVVQVTHDLQSALDHSDRILVLENGRSVAEGSPEEIAEFLLENPVQGLLVPPLVQFTRGLRERGVKINLTGGIDEIIAALGGRGNASGVEPKRCSF
ncbi:MAG: energy-coupling factor ABC transporter ATP-binding protein [Synergistaceae bacterium]|jgi:energy-coupling factor transport system ATP-binding protein|nr:energy-coupling factor ABC transporter ATP-binding protein [Synergistaceae bacterium]